MPPSTMSEMLTEPLTTINEWDTARARFSHDWLKNGFAVALGKFANVLAGAVEAPDAAEQVLAYLHEWPAKREEIDGLIDMAPVVLSPAALFRQGPLSTLEDKSRNTIGALMDEKWRQRVQPERLAGDAKTASRRVDAACEALKAFMSEAVRGAADSKVDQVALVARLRNTVADFAGTLGTLGRSKHLV